MKIKNKHWINRDVQILEIKITDGEVNQENLKFKISHWKPTDAKSFDWERLHREQKFPDQQDQVKITYYSNLKEGIYKI